jgi:hypothetical protein
MAPPQLRGGRAKASSLRRGTLQTSLDTLGDAPLAIARRRSCLREGSRLRHAAPVPARPAGERAHGGRWRAPRAAVVPAAGRPAGGGPAGGTPTLPGGRRPAAVLGARCSVLVPRGPRGILYGIVSRIFWRRTRRNPVRADELVFSLVFASAETPLAEVVRTAGARQGARVRAIGAPHPHHRPQGPSAARAAPLDSGPPIADPRRRRGMVAPAPPSDDRAGVPLPPRETPRSAGIQGRRVTQPFSFRISTSASTAATYPRQPSPLTWPMAMSAITLWWRNGSRA